MEMTISSLRSHIVGATLLAGAVALAACSNASRTLGLDPEPPDEFTVVSKAPLTIPPDFNLRPPQPGAPRPQELNPTSRAQAALVGDSQAAPSATRTPGEVALLQVARAQDADPDIRNVLNAETTQLAEREGGFVDRLLDRVRPESDDAEVVNPTEEERRLRQQDSAANTGASEQETPIIRRKSRSILSGVF
ncbi:MAG: DUF3035 domain-containing protein [Alphaproteobacteria bacterium]